MKSKKLLIVSVALILVGSFLACLFNTSFFKVKITNIEFKTERGTLAGSLYMPKDIKDGEKRPVIITTHGYLNSKEMQDAPAVEMSRRGYIVLALDMYDHGYSLWENSIARGSEFGTFWIYSIYDAAQYMSKQDYTLKDEKGINFYKNLVKELKENGIKPVATLFHWDLPQILQDEGGWANRKTAEYFVHYASVMFNALGEDVCQWITFNEPAVYAYVGNLYGTHAPGIKNLEITQKTIHNMMLAHGETVKLYKNSQFRGQIGITLNLSPNYTDSSNEEDIKAAKISEGIWNKMFLDPVLKGKYPEIILNMDFGKNMKNIIKSGDMETINQKIDFLGINYYSRNVIKWNENNPLKYDTVPQNNEKTAMGWEVYPDGLRVLLKSIKKDYGDIPLYITENGAAYEDTPENGEIHDKKRTEFLKNHFIAAKKAIDEGVNLKGYYVWSFMDNYEWAEGYAKRFGIVYVDYETLQRTVKDSAKWYAEVIKNNFTEE